jgi:hypothetical protein
MLWQGGWVVRHRVSEGVSASGASADGDRNVAAT